MDIKEFVCKLENAECNGDCENIYKNEMTKNNLINYLEYLKTQNIKYMFVGETPGHKGCAKTGIPFTDENQFKNSDNFFALGDWERNSSYGDEHEISAGCIWNVLREKRIIPLMWNSFPFHPYEEGNINSNRTPNEYEVEMGNEFVIFLM